MPASGQQCADIACADPVGIKGAKGLCPRHYRRSRGTCTVADCGKMTATRGLCSMHYARLRSTGSTELTRSGRVVFGADEACSVPGCGQKRRKREWCASHYVQWQKKGEVKPFAWKWARAIDCVICGKPVTSQGRTCSERCLAVAVRHQGQRLQKKSCERCGQKVDLTGTSRHGTHLRRSDTRMCDDCYRAKARPHKMSVGILAQRDGNGCGICGEPIDLTLRHPDQMRASVDHVIPFSRGGTHSPDNLQLAHLRCNHVKSDRLDYQWASGPRTRHREIGGQTPWQ